MIAAASKQLDVIDVLVLEDDAPTRTRLSAALVVTGRFDVRQAATLCEARDAVAMKIPDVLLSDLRLPDGHGTELIRELRAASTRTEIMVISILGDENSVLAAIEAGASGYLLKDAYAQDIVASVSDLVEGHSPISPSIARYIIRKAQARSAPAADRPDLTARELDILWGIAKGLTYAEIAEKLGLSKQTVPGHIKNIYRKLEVNTRGEAVFEAVQMGLINL